MSTALETLSQLQRGTLRAEDLARSTLERIQRDDAALRAFVCTLDADEAAAQARGARGPMAGMPVAVKDIFDTRDLPTAYGSPIYAQGQPASDAAIVATLRHRGALVIGKSSTTEFAFLHPTHTANPRAPGRTPGGSSAGSAAAVAAGLVPLSVGTQTGGSVIRPASYCGVVGYKPTFGWLPTSGLKCFSWSLDTVGLFARDVADMAWFAQVLTGRAFLPDQRAARGARLGPQRNHWVVGVPTAYPWGPITASAQLALDAASRAMQSQGVELRRCELPGWAAAGFDAHAAIQGFEAAGTLGWELDAHGSELSPTLRQYLQQSRSLQPADYEAAQHIAARARVEAAAWFQPFDALLTPSAPDEAPLLTEHSTGASTFNRLWTLLGTPCISVPGFAGVNGCPMGVQLIAPVGEDARLLQLAAVLA